MEITMKKLILSALTLALAILVSQDSLAGIPAPLEDWCVSQMSAWAPPGKSMYADAKETVDEGTLRYRQIAKDAISVAYDPAEAPLFPGPYGRAKTLATMLGIADSESGFRKDVDFGKGAYAKGDSGKSWCLMQVRLGTAVNGKTPNRVALKGGVYEFVYDGVSGFGGEDLVKDRKACFRVALHIMRDSFNQCSDLPVDERLSIYTSGSHDNGRAASKIRVGKAIKWLAAVAPPMEDTSVLSQLSGGVSAISSTSFALNP